MEKRTTGCRHSDTITPAAAPAAALCAPLLLIPFTLRTLRTPAVPPCCAAPRSLSHLVCHQTTPFEQAAEAERGEREGAAGGGVVKPGRGNWVPHSSQHASLAPHRSTHAHSSV